MAPAQDTVANIFVEHRVDATIISFRRNSDGAVREFRLLPIREKLERLQRKLPDYLDLFRRKIGPQDTVTLSDAQAGAAMEELETFSGLYFEALLRGSGFQVGDFVDEIARLLTPALQSQLGKGIVPTLVIDELGSAGTLGATFPVELLPVAELWESRSSAMNSSTAALGQHMARFLGLRAITVRRQRQGPDVFSRDAQQKTPLDLFAHVGADYPGIARQIAYFRNNKSDFAITEMPGTAPKFIEHPDRDVAGMLFAMGTNGVGANQVAHFCCHYVTQDAVGGRGYKRLSRLDFGNNISFSVGELQGTLVNLADLGRLEHAGRHLVFLNACTSAALEDEEDSLIVCLLRRGFDHIVGSEAELPDRVAGEFATRLYRALLRGMTLGAAVLQARKELIEVHRNPAGLLYTLFGNPGLRLRPEAATA